MDSAKADCAKVDCARVDCAKVDCAKVDCAKVDCAKVDCAEVDSSAAKVGRIILTTRSVSYRPIFVNRLKPYISCMSYLVNCQHQSSNQIAVFVSHVSSLPIPAKYLHPLSRCGQLYRFPLTHTHSALKLVPRRANLPLFLPANQNRALVSRGT